ncbi:hypothetical protein GCK32_014093, partial [Trichostrongylus colubriformis]
MRSLTAIYDTIQRLRVIGGLYSCSRCHHVDVQRVLNVECCPICLLLGSVKTKPPLLIYPNGRKHSALPPPPSPKGLSGADPGRRVKSANDGVVTGRVKEETVLMEEGRKSGRVLSGYAGYEELWESDDDGDLQELSELLRDGFISDYKHGTILPHVLPLELQSQFIDLMDENVKHEILEQEEATKAEMDTDTKDHILECVI